MKPPPFDYVDPESIDDVVSALGSPGSVVLAGGQSLVMAMNLRSAAPSLVVDIRRVPGLDGLTVADGLLVVGSRTTASALLAHPATSTIGALHRAVGAVGHPQTRNRTTIGGTVALAEPVAEVPTTLVTLGGTVTLAGPEGSRSVDAADWITGPYATARHRDELLTAVAFRLPKGPSSWREFVRRRGTFPITGACVAVEHLDGDPRAEVISARVGLCGAAETPIRVAPAESALVGNALTATSIDELAPSRVLPPAPVRVSRIRVGASAL